MLRFPVILLLLASCVPGCQSSTESEEVVGLPALPVLPQEVRQTNSFADVKSLLAKVQKGMPEEQLLKTLGDPQFRDELNARDMLTYVESPGGFGTMKYVGIEISNGFVERVSEGTISIDPW